MKSCVSLCFIGSVVAVAAFASAAPLSTQFTYQGQLKDAEAPAHGDFDMRFWLYDAALAGNIVAGPLEFDGAGGHPAPVDVVNGLFHVPLDFGAVYDNTALWLRVDVRPHGAGSYATLSPRQPLTATPFAIHALNSSSPWQTAPSGAIYTSEDVGIGITNPAFDLQVNSVSPGFGTQPPTTLGLRWTAAVLPVSPVDWAYLAVGGSAPFGGVHFVRESGLDLKFSTESVFDSGPNSTQMTLTGAGNLGIGTTAPAQRLSVIGNGYVSSSLGVGTASPAVRLHVTGGSDTSVGGGGYLLLGNTSGLNISFDNNEIMARNNGALSTLFLNANGGDVVCGGSLDIGYQVVSTGGSTATCPAGKKPIGGGCHIAGDAEVSSSRPTATGWACQVGDQVGFISLTTYAICVNVK